MTQLQVQAARNAFGVDGTGVVVGVLSDSYDRLGGAATDVANADLPGAANPCGNSTAVVNQVEAPIAASDEGRAMAQIVHDLAPKATIRFATAFSTEAEFANNIRALAAAGARVIVDDISYFAEPMYQDGVVAKAISDVTADGAIHFSSAGNSNRILGGNNVNSYEALAYRPTTCPAVIAGLTPVEARPVDCHDFDAGAGTDSTYGFTHSGSARWILGWNEPQFGIQTDLDLFLLNGSGTTRLATSARDSVSEGTAFESLSGTANGSFQLVVARYAATGTPRFKINSNRNTYSFVEYPTSSGGDVVGPTAYGHNVSQAAVAVAAVPYDNAATIETFSSRGPAATCWGPVVGTVPATALPGCVTTSVDLSATDGTANSFFGSLIGGVWRFYGTSAAAPHAAAVAALVLQQAPCRTPAQVLSAMQSTSVLIGGFDANAQGSGRVDANAAVSSVSPTQPVPTLSATGSQILSASWPASTGGCGTIQYDVSFCIDGGACTSMGTVSGTSLVGAAPIATGKVRVRVTARDQNGRTSLVGESAAVDVLTLPVPPTILRLQHTTANDRIELTWGGGQAFAPVTPTGYTATVTLGGSTSTTALPGAAGSINIPVSPAWRQQTVQVAIRVQTGHAAPWDLAVGPSTPLFIGRPPTSTSGGGTTDGRQPSPGGGAGATNPRVGSPAS